MNVVCDSVEFAGIIYECVKVKKMSIDGEGGAWRAELGEQSLESRAWRAESEENNPKMSRESICSRFSETSGVKIKIFVPQ